MSLITLILVLAAAAVLIVLGTTRRKDGGDGKKTLSRTIVTAAAVLVLVGALGFGSVYQLQEDEYAVITTFGKPSVVSTSGLKFKIPIIQQKTIVSKATQGFALGYDLRTNVNNEDESLMISVDFNFVNVDFYVEYRVDDPVKYLYNSEEPEAILKMLCQSYIRDTIGLYGVDDIITTGKAEIQGVIRDKISTRLEQEDIGLVLVNIALQDARGAAGVQGGGDLQAGGGDRHQQCEQVRQRAAARRQGERGRNSAAGRGLQGIPHRRGRGSGLALHGAVRRILQVSGDHAPAPVL